MKILEGKWNGILYEGGFDNFSVNGSLHMEREILYKNNPIIESEKRLNIAYLLWLYCWKRWEERDFKSMEFKREKLSKCTKRKI